MLECFLLITPTIPCYHLGMKLSVSVPDELWERAIRPGDSPSLVVQEAIRMMVDSRADAGSRLLRRAGGSRYGSDDEDVTQMVEELIEKVASDASVVRDTGYMVGFDAAAATPWVELEASPTGPALRAALLRWARDQDDELPETLASALLRFMGEYERLTKDGKPITSPTFCDGVVDGVTDLCDAVRTRLADPGFLPRPTGQLDEGEAE